MIAEGNLVFLKQGTYDGTGDDGQEIAWKDGSKIGYVQAYDADSEQLVRMTLAQDFKGTLPKDAGAIFTAKLEMNEFGGKVKRRLVSASLIGNAA
jgi:hypothetical protein